MKSQTTSAGSPPSVGKRYLIALGCFGAMMLWLALVMSGILVARPAVLVSYGRPICQRYARENDRVLLEVVPNASRTVNNFISSDDSTSGVACRLQGQLGYGFDDVFVRDIVGFQAFLIETGLLAIVFVVPSVLVFGVPLLILGRPDQKAQKRRKK